MRTWKIALVILLLSACKCNNGKDKSMASDTTLMIPDTLLAYDINADTKTFFKHTEVPDSAFTAPRVINGLNFKYPNVQLQLLKQSNDTLFVNVPQSEHLSQKMGSAGAAAWYADAVWNLASVPGVQYVHIQLQEAGSHASPGTFSKADYTGYVQDTTRKYDTQ